MNPHQHTAQQLTNHIAQKHNKPATTQDATIWENTLKTRPTYPPGIWHHALHLHYQHNKTEPTPQHITQIAHQLATTTPYKHEINQIRRHNQHQRDQQIRNNQQKPTPQPQKPPQTPKLQQLKAKARQITKNAKRNTQTNHT